MAEDKPSFPEGPYTEDQLQLLERGWHGRPTMQTVVREVRRLMAALDASEADAKESLEMYRRCRDRTDP